MFVPAHLSKLRRKQGRRPRDHMLLTLDDAHDLATPPPPAFESRNGTSREEVLHQISLATLTGLGCASAHHYASAMHTIESEITQWTLRDDGIIVAVGINPDVPRDRDSMARNLDSLAALAAGTPRPVLWDPRAVHRIHPAAWAEIIERVTELVLAAAILVDDGTEKKLVGYPAAINSLLIPTQMFRSEEAALAWLRTFVD